MKKPYLIAAIVSVVILLGAGGWYLQSRKSNARVILETGNEEVLPPFSTNPLDNKPNINPVDQTNPFKNIKTNPFE